MDESGNSKNEVGTNPDRNRDNRVTRRFSARNFFLRVINRIRQQSFAAPSSSFPPLTPGLSSTSHATSMEDSDGPTPPVRGFSLHSSANSPGPPHNSGDPPNLQRPSFIPVCVSQVSNVRTPSPSPPPRPPHLHTRFILPETARKLPAIPDNLHKNMSPVLKPEPPVPSPEEPANSANYSSPRQALKDFFREERALSKDSNSDEDDYVKLQFNSQMQRARANTSLNDNTSCKIYRMALLNSHRQLLKTDAAHQRKQAQSMALFWKNENTDQTREPKVYNEFGGGNLVCGRHIVRESLNDDEDLIPSTPVFSDEIWSAIIRNLTNKDDIQNIIEACPFITRIITNANCQELFGMVFQFIVKKLSRNDILACRKVCKSWCSGVDRYFESHHTMPTRCTFAKCPASIDGGLRIQHGFEEHRYFDYVFTIPTPLAEDVFDSYRYRYKASVIQIPGDRSLLQMKHHARNPFIGRTVSLHEHYSPSRNLNLIEFFASEAVKFLKIIGHHVWHLTIYCEEDGQIPVNLYSVVVQGMAKCKNLKSLSLRGDFRWTGNEFLQIQGIDQGALLVDRPSLETLIFEINHSIFCLIQDKLLQKYSGQLKRLEVEIWKDDVYSPLPWSQLLHLEVNSKSIEILPCLKHLKAPRLQILGIPLVSGESHLPALLNLTNQFTKLAHLKIDFERPTPPYLNLDKMVCCRRDPTCSSNLTVLEVTSGHGSVISYDFLIYFPFVKKLILRRVLCPVEFLDTGFDIAEAFFLMMEPEFWTKFETIKETELVKLVRFLRMPDIHQTAGTSVYQSDIWLFLPFLRTLEVRNGRYDPEKWKTFSRQGYDDHWEQ